uniref:Partitioning defective protein 3 n=1 Tax=Haemonchus contortus TaxID=6289 RepID=A0A7I4YER1_HAECO
MTTVYCQPATTSNSYVTIDSDVRILRMQCISDEGILDMDDRIIDVFDEVRDQILAIYDEQSPNGSDAADGCAVTTPRGPVVGRVRDSVVEIVSLENPPSNGLRVSSSMTDSHRNASSADNTTTFAVVGSGSGGSGSDKERLAAQPVRSSLRSDGSTPSRHRVTLSPEVEKRLASSGEKDTRLTRGSARKSRLTDSFFDAKERLEDAREASHASPMATQKSRQRAYLKQALDPENTVIVFPNDDLVPLGIEVTGVHDDPASTSGRLSAVQILRIEPDGRVGMDGRLAVGDNIVEIDYRPVYQMSIVRARAYLSELQSHAEPSLTVARPLSSFASDPFLRSQPGTSSLQNRPILSALQQANTVHIGHTKVVELKKTPAGFGFTVTGRETAKGERLFYIGTVKPNGVALGHLRAGDRLLELNGEPTADLTQAEVVDRLKKAAVGDTISFLVSRVVDEEDEKKSNSSERENRPPTPVGSGARRGSEDKATASTSATLPQRASSMEELELIIPLNDTGSAGLGVSLKARVTVRTNGTRQDCGIFIKNVLHGGAAHKDGRLRVNDRIVGIEELRLEGETNATASEAVSRRLKAIGPTAKYVRLRIQRAKDAPAQTTLQSSVGSAAGVAARASVAESSSSEGKLSPVEGMDADYGSRLDESELPSVSDPFSREAPSRKSMSEKRGMGAASDPHHIKLFQDIKHQRQTSAPLTAMSTSLSFHGQSTGRSASQRAAARARSHSVHPRAPAPPKIMKMSVAPSPRQPLTPQPLQNVAPTNAEKRRSLSVESINQDSRAALRMHPAMQYRGALTSDSFRQATEFYNETPYGGQPHPYPPGSPMIVKPRSTSRDKDKQRRKSLGGLTAMKSFLGLGGKSRDDTATQKTDSKLEEAHRQREEEEKRRIREHYERLREKEAEANRGGHSLTPSAARREAQRIYGSPNYGPSPQRGMSTSVPEYESYDLIDRYQMHRYPTAEVGPASGVSPAGITSFHHRVVYAHPQPPPYHYAIPSSNSYHGSPVGVGTSPYQSYSEYPPESEKELVTRPSRPRTPALSVPPSTRAADRRPISVVPTAYITRATPNCGTEPQNLHNSPHITRSTRLEFNAQAGPRVSLRARKKMRRAGVRSAVVSPQDDVTSFLFLSSENAIEEKSSESDLSSALSRSLNADPLHPHNSHRQRESHTLRTNSRVVTAIDDSLVEQELNSSSSAATVAAAFDYCQVWNEWNTRSGGSLPSRRSRQRPVLLGRQVYDRITDC